MSPPELLWTVALGAGVLYLCCFLLARRPVAMRCGRLAGALAVVLGARLALAAGGWPPAEAWDWFLTGAALLKLAVLRYNRHVWLARAAEDQLREQLADACRRLF